MPEAGISTTTTITTASGVINDEEGADERGVYADGEEEEASDSTRSSTALSPDDIPDMDANYNRLTADINSNPLFWTTEEMANFISK